MRFERYELNVPSAGLGNPRDVRNLHDKWLQLSGVTAAGAVFAVEGTVDELSWRALGVQEVGSAIVTAVSVDGIFEVPQNITAIRLNRTTAGAGTGTVTAVLAGRMAHG